MLISEIIEPAFPQLTTTDKVEFAMNLMEDYDVQHLPVTEDEKFAGIISKDDLTDAADTDMLAALQHQFINVSVLPDEHFLTALRQAAHFDTSVVPAIDKNGEIKGIITQKKLIRSLAGFLSVEDKGGIIVLEMDRRNFSMGELSRLIETNDAAITQLNTCTEATTGLLIVTVKINKIGISDIIATLQRYEYVIRYYFGEEDYENELKQNYDLLMTYLNI
ncbi:MAG TPA: CBS domain-containing protein [Panacibacter sp.]|nr:CBS domain-containing protein [Panacibacter sp.]